MNVQSTRAQGPLPATPPSRPVASARPSGGQDVAVNPGTGGPLLAGPQSEGAPTLDLSQSLERLDAYASSLATRVRGAFEGAGAEEQESLRAVMDLVQSGLERVRGGLENGTLTPNDIQRGTENLFRMASDQLLQIREDAGSSESPMAAEGTVEAPSSATQPVMAPSTQDGSTDADRDEAPGELLAPDQVDSADAAQDTDAEEAVAVASRASLGPAVLAQLENVGADLQSLLADALFGGRQGQVYGPGQGAEAIAPRASGLDLAA